MTAATAGQLSTKTPEVVVIGVALNLDADKTQGKSRIDKVLIY